MSDGVIGEKLPGGPPSGFADQAEIENKYEEKKEAMNNMTTS